MLQFGIRRRWDMKNMNGYEKQDAIWKREEKSYLWRKGILKNGKEYSLLGTKLDTDKTLPIAPTTEGIHNRRSFQKHICSVGDLCFQYL